MAAKSAPDVLNALVRVILLKTAMKPAPPDYQLQTAHDAKRFFNNLCAYCSQRPAVDFDHAVPANQEHLGQHYIGNLIPCCRECNDEKKKGNCPWGWDHRQFLRYKRDGAGRTAKIDAYMKADGYRIYAAGR